MMRRKFSMLLIPYIVLLFALPVETFSKSTGAITTSGKQDTTQKSDAAKPKPSAPMTVQPSGAADKGIGALVIQRIHVTRGTVQITLENTGNSALAKADYAAIKLKVETSEQTAPGIWPLFRVDPAKRLNRPKGSVIFDTRIKVTKRAAVKARLIKGRWTHQKSATLMPLPVRKMKTAAKPSRPAPSTVRQTAGVAPSASAAAKAAGQSPQVRAGAAIPNSAPLPPAAQSAINRHKSGADTPRSMQYDGGILVDRPEEGTVFHPGESITVRYQVTRDVGAGDIRFILVHDGRITATVTRPYSPPASGSSGSLAASFQLTLPRFMSSSDAYFIYANLVDTTAHGMSNLFSIEGPDRLTVRADRPLGPAIEILAPLGGDQVVLNSIKEVRFRMPAADSDAQCGDQVTITAVRQSDGHQTRVRSMDAHPGENHLSWPVSQDSFEIGDYQLRFESDSGCTVRTAAFHVVGCDYALDTVTFSDGRPLSSGIDAGSGRTVSGTFRVTVRWNGIPLPPTFAPGTEWGNQLRVASTRTGEVICAPITGANFDYTTSRSGGPITVDVPFSFERDAIGGMRTESRNIPLQFSLHPYGASLDTDDTNNTMTAQMKVLNATETDLHIGIYVRDFSLVRDVHTAGTVPKYDYRFSQTVNLRNRTLNDAGGPPAVIANVPVQWRVEWREAGAADYSVVPLAQGSFLFSNVSGEWSTMTLQEHFSTLIDDAGRSYRLVVIADPDHEFLDPDRGSNLSRVNIGNPD